MFLVYVILTFLTNTIPGILALLWSCSLMSIALLTKNKRLKGYSFRLLISIDQYFNTIFNGSEDETISSRAGKLQYNKKWATYLCWILNKIEKDHCKKSIEEDE